ncbi:MAG TPA: hypothetical protein VJ698_05555 [Noviherbaspirillum sp.]|nr:hypothetical protein [Noviherbaspirillum sp.]HJV84920.1 hypothetical protein [Noviherbaspirillum sp.]
MPNLARIAGGQGQLEGEMPGFSLEKKRKNMFTSLSAYGLQCATD